MTVSLFQSPVGMRGTAFTSQNQNSRGWKGSLEIIEFNPPAKAGPLQRAAQVGVLAGLEYLQRRRLHNPTGLCLFQCSVTLTVKKFLHISVQTTYAPVYGCFPMS